MTLLVDTHCHLNFETFDPDRAEVILRARHVGVQRMLVPGVDLDSSWQAVRLAEEYPEVYAAVGVHPNSAPSWDETSYQQLRELAKHEKVLAIGEIGLDDYRQRAPHATQMEIFRRQLELAQETGLPVVIHTRAADGSPQAVDQALRVIGELAKGEGSGGIKGVFHSYSGDRTQAERAAGLGFMIGITGPVTFKNADQLQALAAELPLDALLLETDAPFLTPHPHRGKRNEPAYVRLVAEQVALLQGISFDLAAETCSQNARRLFQW